MISTRIDQEKEVARGGPSGRQLAAKWLVANVPLGGVFHWNDLKNAFPQISQIDRRGRELRTEHGWGISTYRDDPRLAIDQVRLDKIGQMP